MIIETIEKLLEFANKKGYSNENMKLIKDAYIIAEEYSLNKYRYRKKDRPFINHLISTCSILMYEKLNIETVVAGLLHSVKNDMKKIYKLNHIVGEIVNNYTDITLHNDNKIISLQNVSKTEFAVIAIQLANSIDMIMSGEYESPLL
jgi:(p)ppGpp synthase/HD superfamily hydrolase